MKRINVFEELEEDWEKGYVDIDTINTMLGETSTVYMFVRHFSTNDTSNTTRVIHRLSGPAVEDDANPDRNQYWIMGIQLTKAYKELI